MNRKASRLVVAIAIATAGVAVGARSKADDDQAYPGSRCQFYAPQAADLYFSPAGQKANGLKNVGSSSKYVVCPALRTAYDQNLENIQMRVEGNVTCSVYVRGFTGGGNWSYPSEPNPATFGVDGRVLTWASGGADLALEDDATFSIYCKVPPDGIIYSYQVTSN